MYCYVRDCPNGPNSLKKKKDSDLVKFFPVPEDKNLLEKWKRVVPKSENVLSPKDKLCDSHFLPSEILWFTETKLPNGNVRRLLRDEPILRPDTIPSIFPAEKLEKENATFPIKEKQDTPKPIVKNVPSVLVKERSATPKGIVKNTVVKEKIETPKSNIRIRFKDPVESSGKRNPQRVKRRSTILDDYWTDDELNQVHNPGASKSGSAKKRKTESGPVIRLVPLECLMDKTTPKSKTPGKPIVGNRPSTEEIDHELKKVIEIPLLTRVKPSKSMTIRSKETVQFKPPKRNVSKTKMKIMPHSETLISHDLVTAGHSVGFNEVKTETPDIEEELARMEMDEENEDVKCSDIVIMNPISIGEDESVVVKSEEEDDGYSVNEMRENPTLMNFSEGDEIPTIKSESEEELPVEVASYDNSDNELANGNDSVCVPAIEAVTGSEQGSAALLAENSDSILTPHEQSNELPEVPADVEQNKNVEEDVTNEAELVEKSSAVEAEDAHNNISCDEKAKESEVAKTVEEKVLEERVLEGKETAITTDSGKEGDETGVATEAAREEANAALLEAEPVRQEGESAMDVENKKLLPENTAEVTKPVENEEILKPVESQEIPRPVENEEISKPDESDGTSKPDESEEVVKPVESEVSQAALEETKETTGDGKDHVVSDGAVAGTTNESEPSGAELEKSISEDTDKVLNEDGSRPDDVNLDLPEAGDEPDSVIANENEKGETITDLTTNDEPPKPDDNVIDISDSEEVEADKEPTREASHEDDGVIDVDLADSVPSSSDGIAGEQSSGSPELEPEKEDDESAMETEDGEDSANAQSADIVDDDEAHSDASPAADDDEVAEVEKNTENGKRDGRPGMQSEIDEMDIEAEVARLVSEVEDTAEESHSKEIDQEAEGDVSNSPKQKGKGSADKETGQPQEIVLQDTTNLGGITAAGVQNLFSPETIQEILKQIKLPLTTPVTFRIAPLATALATSSSSSGRGRGRKKGSRGMRGTNRHVVPRASSSNDTSNNSIDLFRHLTRTRTVFDFPTFVTDVDDDIQYWKLCQILKESFHELIETRNTKTSIGKLTLRVALNRPKKPKVQQNNEEPGPQ